MNLENEIRAALRREAAPPDFAAKVLAKAGVLASESTALESIARESTAEPDAAVTRPPIEMKPKKAWLHRPFTLAIAAAVTAVAIIPAVVVDYQHRQEVRGLKARQDLLTALAITQDQFQQTREMIRRTTRSTQ